MLGGSTPSSHFSPLLGLVVNFCYGVMKPVLCASRVLSSSPGCLSFVRCVDFEFPPFSRTWAAYIELAGIVPLGSSQGQDSRESCDNSRTNWGSLEKRGEGDPKFGALTITLERSGRVAKTEETRVVTLVTRGSNRISSKTQFAC